ncbi:uncharacterized protein LOC111626435 [Centruroides sculpturatus]|uniref:uncharacterized protein LOC111626435 n=1 Tax=Centruroides sculpturatus TaxID=218467 RepID=UPI000C6E08E3|nr:uncharacterized protein LOC111626435 [Centruroides sculpturatus]
MRLHLCIRQSKGCNDHRNPDEFLTIVESLSFYNLAKTPRNGNTFPNIISCLIYPKQQFMKNDQSRFFRIDNFLESKKLLKTNEYLKCEKLEHSDIIHQHSNLQLIYYISGYVVKKFLPKTSCTDCKKCLDAKSINATDIHPECAGFTKEFDKGGLIYPSMPLFYLICDIENLFTECFSFNKLHEESILDILSNLGNKKTRYVGCDIHKLALTEKIVRFYIITRMHFYLKQIQKCQEEKRKKQ